MDIQGKHILLVTSVYPFGSHRPHAYFMHWPLFLLQEKTGVKCTVFAPAHQGTKDYVLDGIKVYRFRYFIKPFEDLTHTAAPRKLNNPLYLLIAAFYILLGSWQLFWVCRREKPDLLNVHWPFPHALMALPTSTLLGIPMVFYFHGAELLLVRRFGLVKPILRWLIPMSKGSATNSSYTKSLVKEIGDYPVTVIPQAPALHPNQKLPSAKLSPPETPSQLLCVAPFIERKGIRYLVDALPIVLAKHPVELRLVGSGMLEKVLKFQCQTLNLEAVVNFRGNLSEEDLVEEYANCDIFILPSIVNSKGDTEGLGVVMLEAMYFSKPVIASAVGGIVDVVIPDVTGILVPEKDPQALAKAILQLVKDPEKAKKMGCKGLEHIQNHFSWSCLLPLWQKMFVEALGRASS